MPDWVSHVLIGLIFAELFKIDKKGLVVLGSLLPDFIVKISVLSFFFHINSNLLFVTALYHSPIMGLIIPGLIAPLFKYNIKKTYFYVASGYMLHLFADSFTRYYINGILLFPFSYNLFSFGVLWAEQYWVVTIISLLVYASIRLYKKFYKG